MAKSAKPAKLRRTYLERAMRVGLRRGMTERSRPWLVIGAAAATIRMLHRLTREAPSTVFAEELGPGEGVEIRVLPPER